MAISTDTAKVLCWHCNRPLVGNGGSWRARPLYYALLLAAPDQPVKVHKCCEKDAKESLRYLTARPSSAEQMDDQINDQLGAD